LNASSGGPTAGKAARIGVEFTNTTPAIGMGGNVTVWMPDQRLGADFDTMTTAEDLAAWVNSVRSMKDAHIFGGGELKDGAAIFAHPIDQRGYNSFNRWNGSTPSITTWLNAYTSAGNFTCSMCPLIVILEGHPAEAVTNGYLFRVTAQWYFRYSAGDDRANLMMPIPTASQAVLNHHRVSAEQGHAAGKHSILSGAAHLVGTAASALGHTMANSLADRAQSALTNALSRYALPMAEKAPLMLTL
jgi:hypothetical protein